MTSPASATRLARAVRNPKASANMSPSPSCRRHVFDMTWGGVRGGGSQRGHRSPFDLGRLRRWRAPAYAISLAASPHPRPLPIKGRGRCGPLLALPSSSSALQASMLALACRLLPPSRSNAQMCRCPSPEGLTLSGGMQPKCRSRNYHALVKISPPYSPAWFQIKNTSTTGSDSPTRTVCSGDGREASLDRHACVGLNQKRVRTALRWSLCGDREGPAAMSHEHAGSRASGRNGGNLWQL